MPEGSQPRLQWCGRNDAISKDNVGAPTRLSPNSESSKATCSIIDGDNLHALRALREEYPEQVTLAYLDPPFLTGRTHQRVKRSRSKDGNIARTYSDAFDDRWSSLGEYLNVLGPRLRLIRDLLAPHGSVVLHVDPKTSHYAKVLCDEVFGMEAFSSEVIWRYRRWPAKTRNFQRVHDVMLRYVKDPSVEPRFNQLYEPLAPSTLKTWGDRKQRAIVGEAGRRVRSSKTAEKSHGTPMGDVWEIGIVAPVARERTGYPTQKPEALLKRWIESCSNEGDLILDPYMGSGTTLATAAKLGRRAIGIDLGEEAHSITKARLDELGVDYDVRQARPALAPLRTGKKASKSRSERVSELSRVAG